MLGGSNDFSSHPSPSRSPLRQSTKQTQAQFLDEGSFINLLDHGSLSDQRSALVALRHATRSNNSDLRIAMCTPTLLSSLGPVILSSDPSLRANAIAIVVNLSLEPPNRTRIVKSGILNLLIGLLKTGAKTDAKGLLVAALHSLSVEEKNRTTIGALGAVPPLVEVFLGGEEEKMARYDAGMAIYHLTFSADNRGRVIKTNGSVRRIVGVVKRDEDDEIKSVGMRIVCNLARCEDGRTALMEADGIRAMVGLVESVSEEKAGNVPVPDRRREGMVYMATAAMYGMSKGKSFRFRSMAKSANAAEVLGRVLEERNGAMREMVRRTLKAIRGDAPDRETEERDEWYEYAGSRGAAGSAMSEPVRRWHGSYGGSTAVSEPDWMQ